MVRGADGSINPHHPPSPSPPSSTIKMTLIFLQRCSGSSARQISSAPHGFWHKLGARAHRVTCMTRALTQQQCCESPCCAPQPGMPALFARGPAAAFCFFGCRQPASRPGVATPPAASDCAPAAWQDKVINILVKVTKSVSPAGSACFPHSAPCCGELGRLAGRARLSHFLQPYPATPSLASSGLP